MTVSVAGRLLVAQPTLPDPNFFRSVVYVVDHNAEGAFGVVLNRPTTTPVILVLPEFADVVTEPGVFFEGGPVGEDNVVGLVRDAEQVGKLADLAEITEAPDSFEGPLRLFAGYCGWAPHQLDVELAEGSWVVAEARDDDLFGGDAIGLWEVVLRRQGGAIGRMSLFPEDLSVN